MLFAFVYGCLRLILDIADIRLRDRNPEAELLLAPRAARAAPTGEAATVEAGRARDHGWLPPAGSAFGARRAGPTGDDPRLAPRSGAQEVGDLRQAAGCRSAEARPQASRADPEDGAGELELGLHSDPRRADQARLSGIGNRNSQSAPTARSGTRAFAFEAEL